MSEEELAVNDQPDTDEPQEEMSDEEAAQAKLKEMLEVDVEALGPLRKKLTITVPRELIDERVGAQFDELKQDALVPGFRKGRAPLRLIQKRFGHEVGEQVGSSLIGNSYLAAVEKSSLDVLGDPLVYVTLPEQRTDEHGVSKTVQVEKLVGVEEALDHIRLPKEGALSYSCEIEVRPEFDLPELTAISVKKQKFEITDEIVDEEAKRIMSLRGSFRPVEQGTVKKDDLLIGNAKFVVDGETVKTEENAELAARDQRYDGMMLEGFETACIKKQAGDTIVVPVTVPEDHANVDLRGKSGEFHFDLLEFKRFEAPEATDEFVATLGFESLEEFRSFLRSRLETDVSAHVQQDLRGQIRQFLLENTKLDVPEGMSQRQTDRYVRLSMMDLYRRGVPEAEIMKQVDELRNKAAKEAQDSLRLFFILDRIATDRELDVSDEELNAAIAEIAQRRNRRFDRVRDELVKERQLTTLYLRLRDDKILDQLLQDADVTETKVQEKKAASPKSGRSKKKDASGKPAAEKKP